MADLEASIDLQAQKVRELKVCSFLFHLFSSTSLFSLSFFLSFVLLTPFSSLSIPLHRMLLVQPM